MAFTMYSYFNSTTGDLVISGQEETLGDGYAQLHTPSVNPIYESDWPWDSYRGSIKAAHIGTISPIDVTSTAFMFYYCLSLTSLNLSSFDTSQVTDMHNMFQNCSSLTSLDLSSFDTSKVTDMDNMFNYCPSLTSLDLSNFDTSKVTNMRQMFNYCSSLTSLDLSNFDTSKVTNDMSGMFANCTSLTSLDLSNFDTSHVTDMSGMFYNCSKLTSLDLSSFDTSKVTSMMLMFNGCSSLHIIDIPTTSANIASELPKSTYCDAATGTSYPKADIPGGSVYVDDPTYIDMTSTMIQNREGLISASKTVMNLSKANRVIVDRNSVNVNNRLDTIRRESTIVPEWSMAEAALGF